MPKLRQNIVTGDWVVIAPERAKRPEDFVMAAAPKRHLDGECPFCLTNQNSAYQFSIVEAETNNIYVIPNKFPAFVQSDEVIEEGGNFYFSTKALGGHEVMIIKNHEQEIFEASPELLEELFGVYLNRYKAYRQNPTIEYTMPIHNFGPEAAASIEHPHSQLFSSSIVPSFVEKELRGSSNFYLDKGKCVFCTMISEELDKGARIVAQNDDFIAFTFFAARFPFEIWVLPKDHQSFFEDINDLQKKNFARITYEVLNKLNRSLKSPPFNWWIHSAPQSQNHIAHLSDFYHWHMEIAPRVSKFGGYEMGSGVVIDVVSPELAAKYLQN